MAGLAGELQARSFGESRKSGSEWRQCGCINSGPTTYFSMHVFTVIAGVSVRIQGSVFECFDNRLFLNRNSRFSQAVGGSSGQSVGKNDRFHASQFPRFDSVVVRGARVNAQIPAVRQAEFRSPNHGPPLGARRTIWGYSRSPALHIGAIDDGSCASGLLE